jgi:hypothetical protein
MHLMQYVLHIVGKKVYRQSEIEDLRTQKGFHQIYNSKYKCSIIKENVLVRIFSDGLQGARCQ